VLYCVLKLCTVISTHEQFLLFSRSGFVTLGPFHVHRFICVYLCVFGVFLFYTALLYYSEPGGVDLMGLKLNP